MPQCGLCGSIAYESLGKLRKLKILSLRNNHLNGSIPKDFKSLRSLQAMFLQHNNLCGTFVFNRHLVVVNILFNIFEGNLNEFENSVVQEVLEAHCNKISRNLPSLSSSVKFANFSYNNFYGQIPEVFWKFPCSSFLANKQLYVRPKKPCHLPYFWDMFKVVMAVGGIILFSIIFVSYQYFYKKLT